MPDLNGRRRVVIEGVFPEIDCGRFPIKRVAGESVTVEADIFADGHDLLACVLLHRPAGAAAWTETRMAPLINDRWRASFTVTGLRRYEYTLQAWVDPFATWLRDVGKKLDAGLDVEVEMLVGALLLEETAGRAPAGDAERLRAAADFLRAAGMPADDRYARAGDAELRLLMNRHADRSAATHYPHVLEVVVERERAGYGAWYEMFPRSASPDPSRPGTLADVAERLPYIAGMGFDVLYLPPIHPIGYTKRKGPNNAPAAAPADPGSPWAIGSAAGGHTAVHPDLGTLDDFRRLRDRAGALGMELALDLAYQTAPDHPAVGEHPDWFQWRPDGSVQFAENPPKKYEDIYPFNFETPAWAELWAGLLDVMRFWIDEGVRVFRVDNPHTKSFAFWEWAIAEVRRDHPDVIFLSEAFTRPRVMYRLAKLGFSQSYTYFTWRNAKWEIEQYFAELTGTEVAEYFRPNLWPNTPDILSEYLQYGGRPAFVARFVLAATLGASYGIYGPAFELMEAAPRYPGSEEYLDSEKYQVRHWDVGRPDSLRPLITRVNQIRRNNPALHSNRTLAFHPVDNDQIVAYTKHAGDDVVLTVVNVDPHHTQAGWLELPIEEFGIEPQRPYQVHDLLGDGRYMWNGRWNYVELNPAASPAQIFRLRRRLRSERDFEYFL